MPMMNPEPRPEHRWLHRMVGEWRATMECPGGPGQPASKAESVEGVRSLGGLWVVAEGRGEMPGGGGPATTILTLGYDPQKARFVGTFVGSMMTVLWVYEGTLDAAGTVLTLDTVGPDFAAEGRMARYQDVIAFEGDDHRVMTSRMLGEDGAWHQVMRAEYRRVRG
jgi:hypothetical protein